MSRGGGASKYNVRQVPRDVQAWNPASLAASFQSMFQRVKKRAGGVIDWYLNAKRSMRVLTPPKATETPYTF